MPAPTTRELWSLRDVDFELSSGQSLGIVGRNGAGKSTILKILARITSPTLGVSRTRGRVAALLEVGTGFHPELSGRENVLLNGAILGMGRRDIIRRFDSIVEFAGVERFLDTPVKRYSSGMYLRLAFAVAAHLEPDILVVDEILAVGDAEFQRRCLGRMAEAEAEGRTVVFVSHDLEALSRLCERSLWLDAGQVREEGPTRQIVRRYLASGLASAEGGTGLLERGPVRVEAVRLTPEGGVAGDPVLRDTSTTVEVDLTLSEEVRDLDAAVIVTTASGVRLLDEALDRDQVARRLPGRYRLRMLIPPVLNVGEHTLGLWLGTPYSDMLDEPSLVPFTVHGSDQGRPARVVALELPVTLRPRDVGA
ncbi:polysaccharide ABC transporter ATP-binding protein [Kineococcus aurantiacus]|uniref:ABC-2 type transport system ATP-binding protein/lipopolysaccharide transport system ATP-binding protein n=1 Tax=Kineococcus aurantiacus TaxID=37633 RepID=A0A7Y9J2Y5_9ACTN|nr:ABC-2 type transport system ATP-binding protein/lipopolysaccharide transport system ATP-binding protein [Kineococcus aurantiacus]